MRIAHFPRVVLTLLLALAGASVCLWLRTPIPWMIGPLLATAGVSVLGAPTASWDPLRNAGHWSIGAALGLYFTPQVTALVGSLWWAIVLGVLWALSLGLAFSAFLLRMNRAALPGLRRSTTYFAGAIGGASEMTLLAEREGARTDLVAAAHTLRLLIVTLAIPFAFSFSGLQGIDLLPTGPRAVAWPGLVWLAGLTALGIGVLHRLDRANPWFMGALLVSMVLTMVDVSLSAIPQWLTNAAQLVIGVSLGVRFRPEFLRTAPRWLACVALGTAVMIVLCAGFGALLAWGTGLHPATMILGTAPGGIAEMAITAKVLQLGVPVVTAFQVCRLVAVLVLAEPVYHWLVRPCAHG